MCFSMQPGKKGRLKYLFFTILPAVIATNVINRLAQLEILPANDLTGFLSMSLSLVIMGTLGYFLVLRKNHSIEISEISIAEKNWQGTCRVIALNRIHSWRKNLLNEILLLDGSGKVLLCVESNMENRTQFESWLASRQINEQHKEN